MSFECYLSCTDITSEKVQLQLLYKMFSGMRTCIGICVLSRLLRCLFSTFMKGLDFLYCYFLTSERQTDSYHTNQMLQPD